MRNPDRKEAFAYWNHGTVPGLSFLTADLQSHEYPAHVHDSLLIAVTEEGGSQVRTGSGSDEAHPRALLVVNPWEPHSSRMNTSHRWRYRSLYLGSSGLNRLHPALGLRTLPAVTPSIVSDPELIRGFDRLHRLAETASHDSQELWATLLQLLGDLFVRYGHAYTPPRVPSGDRAKLNILLRAMREHLCERLTLRDLARASQLTEFQVIGLFHRSVGMPPHAYMTQLRLQEAMRLLKAGAPIAVAAADCGFYDQAALTRHFKRCFGITPRQFAAATRF